MGRPKPTRAVEAWGQKYFNPLNAELNPICYLLALLGAHHIFHVSGLRVKLNSLKFAPRALANGSTLTIHYLPNTNIQ